MILEYIVKENDPYQTIRNVVKEEFLISQKLTAKLKRNQRILLNNSPMYLDKKVQAGDIIRIQIDFYEGTPNIVPTKMNLDILYEDESFLIINKPPKMAVHPSNLHYENSLANGVRYYYDSKNSSIRIHLVNRLDKNTSGIVIFAKNEYIQENLIRQMKNKAFQKEYLAILTGKLTDSKGTIDAPIARKEGSIIERIVSPSGENAITHFELMQYINNNSFVKFFLETGRTHQIRVHSKYIGHPILGDTLYGEESNLIDRQALHSYFVSFIHPITKQKFSITCPIPEDMKKIIINNKTTTLLGN